MVKCVSERDGTTRGNYISLTDAGADLKTAYEAQADTNAYTDTEKSKLGGVASGADVTGSNAPQAHAASHQNAGGDEIIVALTFTQLAGGENNAIVMYNVWTDWDLSAIIGAGAQYVELMLEDQRDGGAHLAARKNGSALVPERVPLAASSSTHYTVACDANRVIEIIGSDVLSYFNVAGYWS